jgi:hypothetical protein
VAELGTSKSGGAISQLGCSTSVACHGSPREQQQQQQHIAITMKQAVNLKKLTNTALNPFTTVVYTIGNHAAVRCVCHKIRLNIALRIEAVKYQTFYTWTFCEEHINPRPAFHVSRHLQESEIDLHILYSDSKHPDQKSIQIGNEVTKTVDIQSVEG